MPSVDPYTTLIATPLSPQGYVWGIEQTNPIIEALTTSKEPTNSSNWLQKKVREAFRLGAPPKVPPEFIDQFLDVIIISFYCYKLLFSPLTA